MSSPCPRPSSSPCPRPRSSGSPGSTLRRVRRPLIAQLRRCLGAAALIGLLGACADGGYPSGQASQFGGAAPDLNCQFGSPCANARGSR